MIAVDSSALLAIVSGEAEAERCKLALARDGHVLISAGTMAEALIVAGRRGAGDEMARLLDAMGFEVINVTEASARQAAAAYERWGKGAHPAALNYGDCFAYQVAREYGCSLLYVGEDFAKTDIAAA